MLSIINNHLINYPTPTSLNYFWGFGSLAGICLGIQIITGILLAMHYTPHISLAFISIEHIIRDINNGWLIRYLHSNGGSIFFIVTYIHIARGIYFKSYRKKVLWLTGIIIFLLMMSTAFLGYVLPWGQMSFWGATVITNLFTSIPLIGISIANWLWGGFSIDNATLNRFFSLHYLLPFIIVGLVLTHISVLHMGGSTNPLSICSELDSISFYPYFILKDLFGLLILALIVCYFIFFDPNILNHSDNYIKANPIITPTHIVPEWYFLPFYAILRSIPNKLGGVIFMFLSILILLILPLLPKFRINSLKFDKIGQLFFWLFICDIFFLGWVGGQLVEYPFILLSQLATIFYFSYLVFFLPALLFFEVKILKYKQSFVV
jgi:quinol-cytochrome oxidoreductase complex cytochrome b subunit